MNDKKENINQQVKKLDELISYFEKDDKELDIDKDISKYEAAMQLVKKIKSELDNVELKINQIKAKYEDE